MTSVRIVTRRIGGIYYTGDPYNPSRAVLR
jgi:hypothetical protein